MHQSDLETDCPKNFDFLRPYFQNYENELKELVLALDQVMQKKVLELESKNKDIEEKLLNAEVSHLKMKQTLEKKERELQSMTEKAITLERFKDASCVSYEQKLRELRVTVETMTDRFLTLQRKYRKRQTNDHKLQNQELLSLTESSEILTNAQQSMGDLEVTKAQRLALEEKCAKLESQLFAKTIEISDRRNQLNSLETAFRSRVDEIEKELYELTLLKRKQDDELASLKVRISAREKSTHPSTRNFRSQFSASSHSSNVNTASQTEVTQTRNRLSTRSKSTMTSPECKPCGPAKSSSEISRLHSDLAAKSKHISVLEGNCTASIETIRKLEAELDEKNKLLSHKIAEFKSKSILQKEFHSAICQTTEVVFRNQSTSVRIIPTQDHISQVSPADFEPEFSTNICESVNFPGFLSEVLTKLDDANANAHGDGPATSDPATHESAPSAAGDQSREIEGGIANTDGRGDSLKDTTKDCLTQPRWRQISYSKDAHGIKLPPSQGRESPEDGTNFGALFSDLKTKEEEWLQCLSEEQDGVDWLDVVPPFEACKLPVDHPSTSLPVLKYSDNVATYCVLQADSFRDSLTGTAFVDPGNITPDLEKGSSFSSSVLSRQSVIMSPSSVATSKLSKFGLTPVDNPAHCDPSFVPSYPPPDSVNLSTRGDSCLLRSIDCDNPKSQRCIPLRSQSFAHNSSSLLHESEKLSFSKSPSPWFPSGQEEADESLGSISDDANFNLSMPPLRCNEGSPREDVLSNYSFDERALPALAGELLPDMCNVYVDENALFTSTYASQMPLPLCGITSNAQVSSSYRADQFPPQRQVAGNFANLKSTQQVNPRDAFDESSSDDWDPNQIAVQFLTSERCYSARLEKLIDERLQNIRASAGVEITARHDFAVNSHNDETFSSPPNLFNSSNLICPGTKDLMHHEQRTIDDFTTVFVGFPAS